MEGFMGMELMPVIGTLVLKDNVFEVAAYDHGNHVTITIYDENDEYDYRLLFNQDMVCVGVFKCDFEGEFVKEFERAWGTLQ